MTWIRGGHGAGSEDAGLGRNERNDYRIYRAAAHDQVKFVICDRQDYEWARFKLDEYQLASGCRYPVFSQSRAGTGHGSWRSGSWRTTCRCGCSCNCTRLLWKTTRALIWVMNSKTRVIWSPADSTLHVLAMARMDYHCYTLSFDYGQRHRAELLAAERVSAGMGCRTQRW